jgi:hypothetical protein
MAYDFNGSNQYLTTATNPCDIPLTMSAQINPRRNNVSGIIIAITNNTNFDRHNMFLTAAGGGLGASTTKFSTNVTATSTSTTAIPLNTWSHTAAVFASTSYRQGYLNGVASTANTTSLSVALAQMSVGARIAPALSTVPFLGSIAEVGIWNAALTQPEIASLAKGITCDKVRPQSLVFYAPLVRDLIDYKGGLTITNNNTATVANHPRVYA